MTEQRHDAGSQEDGYEALIRSIDERDRACDDWIDEQDAEIDRRDRENDERHRQLEEELGHPILMPLHTPHIPYWPHTPHPPRFE